jgi:exopolyphosphatase/guanosine-5'-triphosphate,3'-diphosphate pyrophosphatase
MNSYRVGSVSWSQKYFPQGQFTEQAFNQAKVAAQAVLEEALVMYPRDLWDKAYGASGTVGAVADVLQLAGWTPGQITRDGLAWLIQCVQAAQHFSRLRLEGLKEDRRAVIGGVTSAGSAHDGLLDCSGAAVISESSVLSQLALRSPPAHVPWQVPSAWVDAPP